MKKLITLYNQSLFDLALEIYGSFDMVTKLSQDNGLSITSYINSGTIIFYDENYFVGNNIATSFKPADVIWNNWDVRWEDIYIVWNKIQTNNLS